MLGSRLLARQPLLAFASRLLPPRLVPRTASPPCARASAARGLSSQQAEVAMAAEEAVAEGADSAAAFANTPAAALASRLEQLGLALAPPGAPLPPAHFQIIPQSDIPADGTIVKSLLWQAGGSGEPVAVVLAVGERVARAKLAAALGGGLPAGALRLMDPEHAMEAAGAPMGSVPPVGHAAGALRTVVDAGLLQERAGGGDGEEEEAAVVYGGGGDEGWELRLRLSDLLAVSGATVADIAAADGGSSSASSSAASLPAALQQAERKENRGRARQREADGKAAAPGRSPSPPGGIPTAAALRKAAAKPDGEQEVRRVLFCSNDDARAAAEGRAPALSQVDSGERGWAAGWREGRADEAGREGP